MCALANKNMLLTSKWYYNILKLWALENWARQARRDNIHTHWLVRYVDSPNFWEGSNLYHTFTKLLLKRIVLGKWFPKYNFLCGKNCLFPPSPEGKLMCSKNYSGAKSYFCANTRKFCINIKGKDTINIVSYMAKCELLESGKVPYGLMLTRMLCLWISAKMLVFS